MSEQPNKRRFFRLKLQRPLGAELRMVGVHDSHTVTRTMKTALLDLSAGGARFIATDPLPDEKHLLVELRFTALGRDYKPLGVIVRTVDTGGHPQYCAQFSLDEQDTATLASVINQLSIKLRRSPVLSSCSFVPEEELEGLGPF
ncbi:PAS/PAC and GAF sensor-containing diguanylate cyclase/phosphodiesterase [Paenibacillus mucilaginosus 3016]|uniref:PAS/PAC and GAF sensor-containing diguanylate cyclase/phosphodiesterase n=1 Tax=Paenibacillus mucilaginosus 3016 TaxID=1116391 RepID=H6NB85_9BACL|nr:PilZ domain-containing protein [Paenibacillus mucilaginosus]AFC32053.1 PAS/PAC and GAF sensor-containing diguanylate cyclase/phosphodiesterase [Paenibacillus mucilaginosus 3016]WFA20564.1 PilZ domain-containing protein [Paenibacillus mucilaginosus]